MRKLFKVEAVSSKGIVLYRAYQAASSAEQAVELAKMYAGKIKGASWAVEPTDSR